LLRTPWILPPQSPHLGPLASFLTYCVTKRPPGVFTLRRNHASATHQKRREKKKNAKEKNDLLLLLLSFFLFLHSRLLRLGVKRRATTQRHSLVALRVRLVSHLNKEVNLNDTIQIMSFEQTLAQINQCFVYKLPPRTNMRGYRAADWNASEPLWQVTSFERIAFVSTRLSHRMGGIPRVV
jgi:hypothetical protein